jgi:hypothetical protein
MIRRAVGALTFVLIFGVAPHFADAQARNSSGGGGGGAGRVGTNETLKLGGTASDVVTALPAPTSATTRPARATPALPRRVTKQHVGTNDVLKLGGSRFTDEDGGQIDMYGLVPNDVGLTVTDRPRLLWYLSKPVTGRIEFAITEEGQIDPLLELQLDPSKSGVRIIDLAQTDKRLKPDTNYEWVIAVVRDEKRRARDTVTGGFVRLVKPSDGLSRQLTAAGADPLRRAAAYAVGDSTDRSLAGQGIWYDALSDAARALSAKPSDADARGVWDALLDEVIADRDDVRRLTRSPAAPAAK